MIITAKGNVSAGVNVSTRACKIYICVGLVEVPNNSRLMPESVGSSAAEPHVNETALGISVSVSEFTASREEIDPKIHLKV